MLTVGDYNTLRVVKHVDFGIYLDGGEYGEILMPKKYVPENVKVDEEIEVFIYPDSEDRLVATTEKPYATVNEFAYLKVKEVNRFGAFLEWGILKNLLVPFREQKIDMMQDRSYIVYIYKDEKSNRLAASAKINKYLSSETPVYDTNDEVEILIYGETEIGYKAVVDNQFSGLLYSNEIYKNVKIGDKLSAFVKKVREDGKIDLMLQRSGYEQIDTVSNDILRILKKEGGFIAVTDNSSPETVKEVFGISKKSFKKAVGTLYKQRLIKIEETGLRLV
jgi:predicted RNA-binding protein (virulence factor B family)